MRQWRWTRGVPHSADAPISSRRTNSSVRSHPQDGRDQHRGSFKAAGWIEALRMQDPLGYCEATPQHMHAHVHTSMVPKGFYDYGFAVVRNPFARVASEYKMRAAQTGWSVPFPEWFQLGVRRLPSTALLRRQPLSDSGGIPCSGTGDLSIRGGHSESYRKGARDAWR